MVPPPPTPRASAAKLRPAGGAASRRRAADTTARLRSSIVTTALTRGLDDLRASDIAEGANVSTGAIYSRYENADEMAVDVWTESVRATFFDHIADVVGLMTDSPTNTPPTTIGKRLERPSALLRLGAESLIVAGRNDALNEVVLADVEQLLTNLGVNSSTDSLHHAKVLIGASVAVGTALRGIATGGNSNWSMMMRTLVVAARRATTIADNFERPAPAPRPLNTGDPTRDRILEATASVIGRSGLHRSTISRIARRANVPVGTLYSRYTNKEAFVNNLAKTRAFSMHRGDFGFADSFHYGMYPERRSRINFRLETIIASRHHASTRRTLQGVFRHQTTVFSNSFPHIPRNLAELTTTTEQALGFGHCVISRYSQFATTADYFSLMSSLVATTGLDKLAHV
ncbi:MAG: TetR family transcriptional regulator [Actinobacteria bacterium]|nr:TetR family transcriptional regulator [Actinomycetota bacterium]